MEDRKPVPPEALTFQERMAQAKDKRHELGNLDQVLDDLRGLFESGADMQVLQEAIDSSSALMVEYPEITDFFGAQLAKLEPIAEKVAAGGLGGPEQKSVREQLKQWVEQMHKLKERLLEKQSGDTAWKRKSPLDHAVLQRIGDARTWLVGHPEVRAGGAYDPRKTSLEDFDEDLERGLMTLDMEKWVKEGERGEGEAGLKKHVIGIEAKKNAPQK